MVEKTEDEKLAESFNGEVPAEGKKRGRPPAQKPQEAHKPEKATEEASAKEAETQQPNPLVDLAYKLPKQNVHTVRWINANGYLWLIPFDEGNSTNVKLVFDEKAQKELAQLTKGLPLKVPEVVSPKQA